MKIGKSKECQTRKDFLTTLRTKATSSRDLEKEKIARSNPREEGEILIHMNVGVNFC